MNKLRSNLQRICLVAVIAMFIMLLLPASQIEAQAPWPPFWYVMTPRHEDGKITYTIKFYSRVDWEMPDLTFKIPLPEGTRYLSGNAQETTEVTFDGQEITFITSTFHARQYISTASFTVEVIDPSQKIYTTHAWVSWKGDHQGDYLTYEIPVDISRATLDWLPPPRSNLLLRAEATVVDGIITYYIYPKNVDWWRPLIRDLEIKLPIPEGTTFLSAETSDKLPRFTSTFDGREVTFFALQLGREIDIDPLIVKVSAKDVTEPTVATHVWAKWENQGYGVGEWQDVSAVETTVTGDIMVQPHKSQQVVVSDRVEDVPFLSYDLTSVGLQQTGEDLAVTLYTAGDIEPLGEPVYYILFIDQDCDQTTGNWLGADYWFGYNRGTGWAGFAPWDATIYDFDWNESVVIDKQVGKRSITLQAPDFLEKHPDFCWLGYSWSGTDKYQTSPPADMLPNEPERGLPRFEMDD